ncbi:DUF6912 family protein [Flindersiella endophytica]
MRVYLGVTLGELAAAMTQGGFGPAPLLGCAVTPTLREWYAEADLEELEYAATTDAAKISLAKLATSPNERPRRVVVAVDVADNAVKPDNAGGRSAVQVFDVVPIEQIASAHVDEDEAEPVVRAAAEAWPQAEAGDDDAAFTVDEASGFELLWYARQEIPDLLQEDEA